MEGLRGCKRGPLTDYGFGWPAEDFIYAEEYRECFRISYFTPDGMEVSFRISDLVRMIQKLRACLKIHSCHLHVLFSGGRIFGRKQFSNTLLDTFALLL